MSIRLTQLILLSSTLFTGCASIVTGPRQSVGIASNPTNACVWVDYQYIGVTPMIVELTRADNHIVTIAMDGFYPYEAIFTKDLNGWVFGNIIFGGVIGLAVDAITGALYRLTPDQLTAQMYDVNNACTRYSADSYITIVLKPQSDWQKVGNLVAIK